MIFRARRREPWSVASHAASRTMVSESLEFLASVRNYNHWMARTIAPYVGQRLLELGCGTGNILEYFLLRERLFGIDLDPGMVEFCRERFRAHTNCDFAAADVLREVVALDFAPDSVLSLNVLEHVEDDRALLRWQVDQLSPGGRLIALVPAHPVIYGELDAVAGHVRRYTKGELVAKVEGTGLRVTHCFYFNAVGFFGWGLNARLLRRRELPRQQAHFYDHHVVPLQSWLEGIVRPPFGQSLIVVGQK